MQNLRFSPPPVTSVREHRAFLFNESLLSHHGGFAETHLWPSFPQQSDCAAEGDLASVTTVMAGEGRNPVAIL